MSATAPNLIFDRALLRRRRTRAAPGWDAHAFLVDHAAGLLAERLEDVLRDFPLALDLGCHGGEAARRVLGLRGVERVIQADLAPAFAARAAAVTGQPALAADEERLPFRDGAFDLVLSALSLHWVNDLPGALIQIRRALRPDGLFLGCLLGGRTLVELREVLMQAELTVSGGASPRLSPVAELQDMAALMQRAGFALPVVDSETVTVSYDNAFKLFADLRGMGETDAGLARNPATPPRALWAEAARLYAERYADADGRIPATFELLMLTGWAPHASQPQPLRPGSAAMRLAEALGAEERPAGEPTAPRFDKPRGTR